MEAGFTWAGLAGWFLMFAGIPLGNVVPGLVFLLVDGVIRAFKARGHAREDRRHAGEKRTAGTGTRAGTRDCARMLATAIWAFGGLGLVSVLWSLNKAGTAGYSVTLFLVILLSCFGARRLIQNERLLLGFFFPVLVAGTFVTSIYALVDYFMKGGGRADTLGTQCNGLGTVLILSVALSLGYIDRVRGRWLLARVPLVAVSVAALLASMSRGAWVGFTVMGFIYATRTRRALAWVLVIAFLTVAVIYAPPPLKARFLTIWDMSFNGANHDRLELWTVTLKMIERHPLLGVGVGAYRGVYPAFKGLVGGQEDLASAHNIFLQVLAESGILGLILFIYVLYLLGRAGVALLRTGDLLFRGLFAALAGTLVHQLVDTTVYWADIGGGFWLVVGLILSYYESSCRGMPQKEGTGLQPPAPTPGRKREKGLYRGEVYQDHRGQVYGRDKGRGQSQGETGAEARVSLSVVITT